MRNLLSGIRQKKEPKPYALACSLASQAAKNFLLIFPQTRGAGSVSVKVITPGRKRLPHCCALLALVVTFALSGCASIKLTVDDGRKLDDELVATISDYGEALRTVRPAIVETAKLHDADCSKQYELPFDVLTSYGLNDDDTKVAWVRALGVNEKLTVVAAAPSSPVKVGDVLQEVDGYSSSNTLKLLNELIELRDDGRPFQVKLESGKDVSVTPLEVCRGHAVVALPNRPSEQSYHWIATVHPLEVFHAPLTKDEAAWIVLWTQGLSEEGGVRMKTYSYVVGALKWTAIAAIGIASGGAMTLAGNAAAASGASVGAVVGQMAAVAAAGQIGAGMAAAAANRASLSGIDGVAAGVFDKADHWAFEHAKKLGANPRAALTLNDKMVRQGTAANAFALDKERLTKLRALVATLPRERASAAQGTETASEVEVFSVRPAVVTASNGSASRIDQLHTSLDGNVKKEHVAAEEN